MTHRRHRRVIQPIFRLAAIIAVVALLAQLVLPLIPLTPASLAPVALAQDEGATPTETADPGVTDPGATDTSTTDPGTVDPTGTTQNPDTTGLTDPPTTEVAPVDSVPPVVTVLDNRIKVDADAATGTAVVDFNGNVSATDDVDGPVGVSCEPAPGLTFGVGATDISCVAYDAAGNAGTGAFTVVVLDQTPPVIDGHEDLAATAIDDTGVTIDYTAPAATDVVDGLVVVTCNIPSGSTFPVGDTVVTCAAQDAAGNQATTSFTVSVSPAPAPEPTNTPVPEPTNTPVPEPTKTPVPEPTNTPVPAATNTPVPEPTNTPTPEATNTPTPEPTATATSTATATPTKTITGPPTIVSDKADYAPGEFVTLTGSNWQPGELVHIYVNDDQGMTWSRNLDVTADAGGAIVDAFNLPNWFVATYRVVATGPISGTATTSFTDGNLRFTYSPSGVGDIANVTWTKHSNSGCTGPSSGNGSGTITNNPGGTLQVAAGTGEWIKLAVPANVGTFTFVNWTGSSGTASTTTTLCAAGFASGNNGDYVANYTSPPTVQATTLTVTAASGTYGGTVNLSATLTAGGTGVSGKTVNFTLNGAAVGSGTTNASGVATLSGAGLSSINAGSYSAGVGASFAGDSSYGSSTGSASLNVTKAVLTVTADNKGKAFGAANPTLTASYSGFQNGETLATSGVTGSPGLTTTATTTSNVATYPITAALGSLSAGNYSFSFVGGTLTITKATATLALSGLSKTYTGSAQGATVTTTPSGLTGVAVTYDGLATVPTSAGSYAVVASLSNPNYQATSATGTLTIAKATLTGSFTADNKIYDGTTAATIATRSLTGVLGSDTVTLAGGTATFSTANVGTGKTVTGTGFSLTGASAGNYALSSGDTLSTTASITAKSVTGSFTANNKVYDGTNVATIATRALTGAVPGENVTLTGGTATFADKNVGTGKTVTGTGFTLGGADAGNYSLASTTPTTTANITAKSLTGSFTAANKVYDGTTAATVSSPALSGVITGDAVSLSITSASFGSAGVGSGKTVTGTGFSLTGAQAGNYTLAGVTTTTANITARPITVTADSPSKVYGAANPAFSVSYSGFVNGDGATALGGTLVFDTTATAASSIGTYAITPKGLSSSNYNISFVDGTLTVTKATLSVTADSPSRVYGEDNPSLTGTITGIRNGDDIVASYSTVATIDSAAGTYPITASVTSTPAETLDNYEVTLNAGTLTIEQASTNTDAADKSATYGTETVTLTATVSALDPSIAVVSGGSVTFTVTRDSDGGEVGTAVSDTTITNGAASATFDLTDVNAGFYSILAEYEGTGNFLASSNFGRLNVLTVNQATPIIAWDAPARITYGTALSDTQLNATANVAGTLTYDPAAGTVLAAGTHELSVSFTPNDTTNYTTATKTVSLTVNKASQTITFGALANKTYGDDDFTVSATASSGLPVSFAASGNCTISDATVTITITGAGTCTVTASQGGNSNYNAAASVDQTFEIGKATATLALSDLNPTYDGSPQGATVTTTPVGLGDITVTYDESVTVPTNAGSYAVVASLDNANYQAENATGTLVIAAKSLTGSFTAESKGYDGTTAATVASPLLNGVVTGDVVSLSIASASFNTKDVGTAKVVTGAGFSLTGADAGNYVLDSVATTTADITARPITVTADAKSKTYGDADPALTYKVTSGALVTGDSFSYGLTRAPGESVGSYAITQGDLELSSNYTLSFTGASLTITARPITVTADPKTKTYGATDPSLSYQITSGALVAGDSFTGSLTREPGESVGSYAISKDTLALSGNYQLSFVGADLAITKAALTVTAENATREYGVANPTFAGILTGVTNGDDITASYASAATSLSPVGTYPIVPSLADPGDRLSNYDVTLTSGTLTVEDTTAPGIDFHANIIAEATGASGALVTYTPPATTDAVDGPGTATCLPASGSPFGIGTTTVTCTAVDAAGNDATATFTVTVRDTTAPVLTLPADLIVEATGATTPVTFSASATDLVDGSVAVTCTPASGTAFGLGTYSVSCSATDVHSNSATGSIGVTVVDTTAPVIASHATIIAEATGPAGALVTYTAPATSDAVGGAGTATCLPAAGTFAIGGATVTCTATDAAGNVAVPVSFTVTVRDTTAPVLSVPADQIIEATSTSGAVVSFAAPAATDAVDATPAITCSKDSNTVFPLGTTTIRCTAADHTSPTPNVSAEKTFTITVRDTTAPVIAAHADVIAEATGPLGATVAYSSPATSDAVGGAGSAACTPASGGTFAIGATTVTCNATDAAGNHALATTFKVTVKDTTAPVVTAPSNITREATSASGATVSYTLSATDAVTSTPVIACNKASGTVFPLGTTTVLCTATDGAGNISATASFTVTVVDTTKPVLTLPGNLTIEATGATTPVSFSASATDLVDGARPVICTPPSGSSFGLGTFTVSCSATDTHTNTASGSFSVTVRDTTKPVIAPVANITVDPTSAAGAAVTFQATATDAVSGSVPVSCTRPSGSTFAIGTTTVTCTATDGAGNAATPVSFTVTVRSLTLRGFYAPVDMGNVTNTVKQGSTVPLKFEVFSGATELTDTAIVKSVTHAVTAGTGVTDAIEEVTTGTPGLRYDTTGGQFIYNWSTKDLRVGNTYIVTLTLQDGTRISAIFKMK